MSDLSKRIENLPPEKLSKLIEELRSRKSNGGTSIKERDDKNIYPMSFAQSRLWFLHQLQPDSSFYIIPAILRITGDLNLQYLENSFREIIKRHEVLRSYFPEENGEPNQKLHRLEDFHVSKYNYEDKLQSEHMDIGKLALKYTTNKFDLQKDYLFNVSLLRISKDEHILFITMHHIIADGWSIKIFVNEFIAFYEAMVYHKESSLPEISIQYSDFAEWQNLQLKKGIYDKQYSFWKEKLSSMPQTIDLPLDKIRPKVQTYSGKKIKFSVEKKIVSKITEYSAANGITPFMVLLTSFQILLFKISKQEDFGIGIPFVNRNNDETKQLIGFFINTLVIRAETDAHSSFTNSTMKVKDCLISAMANGDLPFEKVVEAAGHKKDLSFSPLFQVMFDYQDKPLKNFEFGGVKATKIEGEVTSIKFDLMLSIENNGDNMAGAFEFNTDLFEVSTIERFIHYYDKLLKGLLSEPDKDIYSVSILPDTDLERILKAADQNTVIYPKQKTLPQIFKENLHLYRDYTAVEFKDKKIIFSEIDEESNKLSNYLLKRGVGRENIIAVCLERSIESIISILAIWKAGGAYLPLDPAYPDDRLEYILDNSDSRFVITNKDACKNLRVDASRIINLSLEQEKIKNETNLAPFREVYSENLAYVIYTSGSTGFPKGVMISHQSAINLLDALNNNIYSHFQNQKMRISLNAPLPFDASIQEIIMMLNGHTLVIIPEEIRLDADSFISYMKEKKIEVLDCVPTQLEYLTDYGLLDETKEDLKILLPGGEPIPTKLWNRLISSDNIISFNMYGPTECTVDTTICNISEGFEKPNIGSPIGNVQHYVLDEKMEIVPVGLAGELYISGDCLARGYYERSDLTAERFIPNPFGIKEGERIYKTGDLVRMMNDGRYEYLKRIDDQVKIRGFRIELGEIENILNLHHAVKKSVVVTKIDRANNNVLVAYVQLEKLIDANQTDLKGFLTSKLPHYMIPAYILIVDAIPLLPNGKIDRNALSLPDLDNLENNIEYSPPINRIEGELVEIWKELLNLVDVGTRNNFFELGGDSIKAAILSNKLKKRFNIPLYVKNIFQSPTISSLAEEITSLSSEQLSKMNKNEDNNQFLKSLVIEKTKEPVLSFAQERLWFLNKIDNNESYNISGGVKLKGNIDFDVINKCLSEIINRHDSLRLKIGIKEGKPEAEIQNGSIELLEYFDLGNKLELEKESELKKLFSMISHHIFDLAKGPLAKFYLIKFSDFEYYFLVNIHHIISDGWSVGLLLNEFTSLYNSFKKGRNPSLKNLEIQYSDYANWQKKLFQNNYFDLQIEYWKHQLSSLPNQLNLPTDFSRPPVQTFNGDRVVKRIDESLFKKIQNFSKNYNVTKFLFLLTVFKVLLYKYSNETDIFIGTPVNGRTREEFESLIGMFVNTLVLRNKINGNFKFEELLENVKQTNVEAFANQDIPFQKLVDVLQPQRNLSLSPLFQHMFVYNISDIENINIDNVEVEQIFIENGAAKYDLTFEAVEHSDNYAISVEFNSDLFLKSTIERLIEFYCNILEQALENKTKLIDKFSLVDYDEQKRNIAFINNPSAMGNIKNLFPIEFSKVANNNYNKTAIEINEKEYSYELLEIKSNKLANYLLNRGVLSEEIVGICMQRSFELISSLVGTLKSGAAYLPIEPQHPSERIDFIIKDSAAKYIITESRYKQLFNKDEVELILIDESADDIDVESEKNPHVSINESNLCYVIYTSGSTGKSKGTLITHGGLNNYLSWTLNAYPFRRDYGSVVHSTLSFDATVTSIYPSLLSGKKILLLDDADEIGQLVDHVQSGKKFSILKITPAHTQILASLIEMKRADEIADAFIVGGENLTAEHLAFWQEYAPETLIFNEYGPTETVVGCVVFEASKCRANKSIPIGNVIPNMQIYVLDKSLAQVPIGVVGELYIGGIGLARGYLNKPELTAERFVPNPFDCRDGDRIYKTGDLVRIMNDGKLLFIGRTDDQVKIRGYRIELDEIKSVLDQNSIVDDSVILVRELKNSSKVITAYVVSKTDIKARVPSLIEYLEKYLPSFMIPNHFIQIDRIPVNINGKIDKGKLPEIDFANRETHVDFEAPSGENEKLLEEIWEKVLDIRNISAHDNFFELGGDSILGIQVISKANQAGLNLSPKDIFQFPTIRGLAANVKKTAKFVPQQGTLSGEIRLTPIQKWFFSQNFTNINHWNQSILFELENSIEPELLRSAIRMLILHHDSLRIKFKSTNGNWIQYYSIVNENIPFEYFDISSADENEITNEIEKLCDLAQSKIDIVSGPLFMCCYFDLGDKHNNRLFFLAHHLIIDGISWRILLTDLQRIYNHLKKGEDVSLPPKTTSFKYWAEQIDSSLNSKTISDQVKYWKDISIDHNIYNPENDLSNENKELNAQELNLSLDQNLTELLIREVSKRLNSDVKNILITALVIANSKVNGFRKMVLALEGHGRENLFEDVDTSNTIGWFTAIYPAILDLKASKSPIESLKLVKEQLREIPNNGIGYGILYYLENEYLGKGDLAHLPAISFNYLGQFNHEDIQEIGFKLANEHKGKERAIENKRPFQIDISVIIQNGELNINWIYNSAIFSEEDQMNFLRTFMDEIKNIIQKSETTNDSYSPTDFQDVQLEEDDLDSIFSELNDEIDDE